MTMEDITGETILILGDKKKRDNSLEQATGIGPAYLPWQGSVLPLNYACKTGINYKKKETLLQ